jgi:uncharacterized protein (TIGR02284 family)
MKYSKRVSDEMNKLLEKNYDAEKEYITAANIVNSESLKQFFSIRAEEKSFFAKELRTEILLHGQIPENREILTRATHRNWVTLKSTLKSNDEKAIINEVFKGEKESLKEYDEVLGINEFTPSTLQLLEKQRQQISSSIYSLKVDEYTIH